MRHHLIMKDAEAIAARQYSAGLRPEEVMESLCISLAAGIKAFEDMGKLADTSTTDDLADVYCAHIKGILFRMRSPHHG